MFELVWSADGEWCPVDLSGLAWHGEPLAEVRAARMGEERGTEWLLLEDLVGGSRLSAEENRLYALEAVQAGQAMIDMAEQCCRQAGARHIGWLDDPERVVCRTE